MPEPQSKDLTNLVNASGFAFQMAVEQALRSSTKKSFKVIASEHPWRDAASGENGFIDLILESGAVLWVIECKRSRDGTWIFLVPKDQRKDEVYELRSLWLAGLKDGRSMTGLDQIGMNPPSPEAKFCVIRGSGEGDRSLLERTASQVVRSMECLANEDAGMLKTRNEDFGGFYVPMIVTTATLQVCRFDPSKVSLKDGTIPGDECEFQEVPFIRFTKSLLTTRQSSAGHLRDAVGDADITVLVVNAQHLVELLNTVRVELDNSWEFMWPWQKGQERLKASSSQ